MTKLLHSRFALLSLSGAVAGVLMTVVPAAQAGIPMGIPEPTSMSLLGMGLLASSLAARRKRKQATIAARRD